MKKGKIVAHTVLAFSMALLAGCGSGERDAEAASREKDSNMEQTVEAGAHPFRVQERHKMMVAKERIRDMKKAVVAHVMDRIDEDDGRPDSLQQLIDDGDMRVSPDFLIDPWGKEYIFSKEGKDGEFCEIYSAGPDGIAGTADDVHAKTIETARAVLKCRT